MLSSSFINRTEAGVVLAPLLQEYRRKPETLILALVRGGVAVGRALADQLQLPLCPYVVRKIGHPEHREFGVGALAEGGATYWDRQTLAGEGLTEEDLQPIVDEEMREMKRRTEAYGIKERPSLAGKTIILVDDGAATGGTLFAAIEDLRKVKAEKIIVALPVAPRDTARLLRERADDAVILHTPIFFGAVGNWYESFPQLTDAEVMALLQG